jgi:hypothetical protein
MGTPDSPVRHRTDTVGCPVRRHVTQSLGSGARSTVGGFVLLRHRTVWCHSDFAALTFCAALLLTVALSESTVALDSRCSLTHRESPVAHRTVR